MKCPLCLDTTLDVTFHAGIELDICPRCRGVWLDRGELERIGTDRPASRPDDVQERTSTVRSDGPWAAPTEHEEKRSGKSGSGKSDSSKSSSKSKSKSSGKKSSKKKRKKNFADRLGDVFEELIDL